jgi:hypothetical protein
MNSNAGFYKDALVPFDETLKGTPSYEASIAQINYLSEILKISIESIPVKPNTNESRALIEEHLGNQDLVIPYGGDNLVRDVTMVLTQRKQDRPPAIVPTGVGFSNDFTSSLTGNSYPHMKDEHALARIIENGKRVRIHPMEVSIKRPGSDAETTTQAINRIGFNLSAKMSQVNQVAHFDPRYQNGRPRLNRIRQAIVDSKAALKNSESFGIWDENDLAYTQEGSKPFSVLERSFIHSHRALRYGSFLINHTDDEILDFMIRPDSTLSILQGALVAAGVHKGHRVREASFVIANNTEASIDGETMTIPAQSVISIHLSEGYIDALSLSRQKSA